MARIKAALRRLRTGANPTSGDVITTAHLRIESGSRQVWVDDALIELTSIEFDMLLTLAEHRRFSAQPRAIA